MAFAALLKKDLLQLLRARELIVASFGLALLLVIVSSFSFPGVGLEKGELAERACGTLWIIFVFSGALSLNQTFLPERENGALNAVILALGDATSLYLAKFTTNFLFLILMQLFTVITLGVFWSLDLISILGPLMLVVALTAFGFSALGTILSAIAVAVPSREVILPIVLFPLLVPLLAGAVSVSHGLLRYAEFDYQGFWFVLICVFDVVFFTLALLLFNSAIRE